MTQDTWNSIALPIMRIIRARADRRPSFYQVVELSGLEQKAVEREMRELIHGGYVGDLEASSLARFDALDLHLHAKGKVAIKEWPGADAYESLLQLVQQRLDAERDPARRSRLSGFLEALKDLGTNAGGELLAGLLRGLG